jgi:hypothetical protein
VKGFTMHHLHRPIRHLQAAGITAVLADAETVGMDWLLGNALGHIKLRVPRGQAQAAREVLGAGADGGGERGEQNQRPAGEETCLACGAALPPNQRRCVACGWSYLEEGEGEPAEEASRTEGGREVAPSGEARAMEALRSWRRPVLILFLGPPLLMLAFAVVALVVLVLQKLTGFP